MCLNIVRIHITTSEGCSLCAPQSPSHASASRAPHLQVLAAPAPSSIAAPAPEYFITIKNGQFMQGCVPFYPAGWNQCVWSWWEVGACSWGGRGPRVESCLVAGTDEQRRPTARAWPWLRT